MTEDYYEREIPLNVQARNFSNLVRPLISADGLFFENWTIFFPLIISAGKVLGVFDFPLIIVRGDFFKSDRSNIDTSSTFYLFFFFYIRQK